MAGGPFDRAMLNRLYRYCLALTKHEAGAYDLLQDGLERYLRSAPNDPDDPMALMRRILRNRFIDGLRNRREQMLNKATPLEPDCVAIGFGSLEDIAIATQTLEQIWDRLGPFDRELLLLWALEGRTAREVAELQAVPHGTVLARIHRLRQRLSAQAEQEEAGEETGNAARGNR
jgi:RNA polymerase sigma-70 factor (ECF subfamily)